MNEMNHSGLILGCDIGNAYGCISALQNPEEDPILLLPGKYHLDMGMPTEAFVPPPDGTPIEVFKRKPQRRNPEYIVRAIKTRLKEKTLSLDGIEEPVDPGKIYASIAEDLIVLANEALSLMNNPASYDLVFTFPATMADETDTLDRMQKSIESVSIDGHQVHVVGRLPEPAAVAIDYLHYMQHIAPMNVRIKDDHFTVLVYDLGYGTFDTAVVTASSRKDPYILHTKGGLPEVGGKDFDEIIIREFYRILKEKEGFVPRNVLERERIREAAINAKLELSKNESSVQSILVNDQYCDLEITRQRFEELSRNLLDQTLDIVQEALEFAEDKGITINAIVLSGGASMMPMVKTALEQLAEEGCPVILYRPSEAVSFGAARYARGITQSRKPNAGTPANGILHQLTDYCYGIWVPSEKLRGEVRFLIPTGKQRPAVSKPFQVSSRSARLQIQVYRLKEQNKNLEIADPDDCDSIRWPVFNVTPRKEYTLTITANEDYSITVSLTSADGKSILANTEDPINR